MRKNIEKYEIYCQSLSSENDNKLQLSRFFDNSAQNFSCHAPRYPRKTALEQKLFASVSEVENVLVCLGQDRAGYWGNILSILRRVFSYRPRGTDLLANPQNINPRWGCGSGGWRRHRRQSRYTGHGSKEFRLDKGRYPAAIGKVGTGLAGY